MFVNNGNQLLSLTSPKNMRTVQLNPQFSEDLIECKAFILTILKSQMKTKKLEVTDNN